MHAQPSAPSTEPDDALIARWRAGDLRAADVLIARHIPLLRRYFAGLGYSPDSSDDLVQETLSRLTRAIAGFEARARFRTYLMSIARNAHTDHLRRGYRRLRFESLDEGSAREDAFAERCVLELERLAAALGCVDELAPETREVVARFYWDDATARELGLEKGIPAGTIRRRLHEARRHMNARYEEDDAVDVLAAGVEAEVERMRIFMIDGDRP